MISSHWRLSGSRSSRCGTGSSRSSERMPCCLPKHTAAGSGSTVRRRSTASPCAFAVAASGTGCPSTLAMTARTTAGSSGGAAIASSKRSGQPWSKSVANSGRFNWKWQAADGMLGEAQFGGAGKTGKNPTGPSRAPRRVRWSRATAGRSGRSSPGSTCWSSSYSVRRSKRPWWNRGGRCGTSRPRRGRTAPVPGRQVDNAPIREVVHRHGYPGRVRPGRGSPRPKRRPGRRRVMERTPILLSKCRRCWSVTISMTGTSRS